MRRLNSAKDDNERKAIEAEMAANPKVRNLYEYLFLTWSFGGE